MTGWDSFFYFMTIVSINVSCVLNALGVRDLRRRVDALVEQQRQSRNFF